MTVPISLPVGTTAAQGARVAAPGAVVASGSVWSSVPVAPYGRDSPVAMAVGSGATAANAAVADVLPGRSTVPGWPATNATAASAEVGDAGSRMLSGLEFA